MKTSAMTIASSSRNPLPWSHSTISTSSAVRTTPTGKEIPNSSCNAIAVPITSARSQAAIASSAMIQSENAIRFG